MIYVSITSFVLINELEKDYKMIETRRLKNVVILMQTIVVFLYQAVVTVRHINYIAPGSSSSACFLLKLIVYYLIIL